MYRRFSSPQANATYFRARASKDKVAKRDCADEALYLEHILDAAAEGAVSLLWDLPREHLGSLRLMANQPIPSRARLDIWKMTLKHTTASTLICSYKRHKTAWSSPRPRLLDIHDSQDCACVFKSALSLLVRVGRYLCRCSSR